MSNDIFDKLSMKLQQVMQQKNNTGYQDVNTKQYQTNKYIQQGFQQNSNIITCTISPGATYYRPLKTNGWPAKYTMCRAEGTVPANIQEFEYKGEVKVYCVEGNNEVIDFSRINENNANVMTLVEVSAPFVGSIFVQRNKVNEIRKSGVSNRGIILG